jgi:hypothetical protein
VGIEISKSQFIYELFEEFGFVVAFDGEPTFGPFWMGDRQKAGAPATWKQWKKHVFGDNRDHVFVLTLDSPAGNAGLKDIALYGGGAVVQAVVDAVAERSDEAIARSKSRMKAASAKRQTLIEGQLAHVEAELVEARDEARGSEFLRSVIDEWLDENDTEDFRAEREWLERAIPKSETLDATSAFHRMMKVQKDLRAELARLNVENAKLKGGNA